MLRISSLGGLAAFGVLMLVMEPVAAAPEGRVRLAQAAATPEPLVRSEPRQRARPQARPRTRVHVRPLPRVRPQIRVYSRYPYRTYHSIYPLPYPIEYPGPNAVRHCVNNYVVEHRLSGDVVVPHMRCWWAPG